MNLYKYHDKPETIHGHDEIDTHVPEVVWGKYNDNPAELKKREDAIAKSARYSYDYAKDILKGPFPKGEAAIAKSAEYSWYYAHDILKGPFPKGEAAIAKDPVYAYRYNTFIKGLKK